MIVHKLGYTIIDHTADIGMEASGKNLEETFENLALGMFAIITDGSVIENEIKKEILLPRDSDTEQLVIDWLSELLYLSDISGLVFGKFRVELSDQLKAQVWGEPYSRDKHGYGAEIKAVTYHLLSVKNNKKGVTIRVLFDV
jgi:SHS2 domain-containing protein